MNPVRGTLLVLGVVVVLALGACGRGDDNAIKVADPPKVSDSETNSSAPSSPSGYPSSTTVSPGAGHHHGSGGTDAGPGGGIQGSGGGNQGGGGGGTGGGGVVAGGGGGAAPTQVSLPSRLSIFPEAQGSCSEVCMTDWFMRRQLAVSTLFATFTSAQDCW